MFMFLKSLSILYYVLKRIFNDGKTESFNCIYCARPVTGRHHAIACDVCGEWQHRKCQTGMLLKVYFRLVSKVITCA